MIGLPVLYVIGGVFFAAMALLGAFDRGNPKRWGNLAFWGLLAVSFLFGSYIGDLANGVLVLALAGLAGFSALGPGKPNTTTPEERRESAARLGAKLFIPALVIPLVTLVGTFAFKAWTVGDAHVVDPKQATLVSLILGILCGLVLAVALIRPRPTVPAQEGRRLLDAVGWAALLPQTLAALGAVFAAAGVGQIIGAFAGASLPDSGPAGAILAVVAYTFGMAIFTIIMGNAFAAFPVMTAGIGLPLIVGTFHGDPVVMAAVGMLSGFCGTLMTPMAANFNIVPAALLELTDRYGVIRAQIPTALILLIANTVLMYVFVY
ncbi:MAG: putative rane protein [Caulobacter sp.]|nr:putative rane protein [Caulobacter sp.]